MRQDEEDGGKVYIDEPTERAFGSAQGRRIVAAIRAMGTEEFDGQCPFCGVESGPGGFTLATMAHEEDCAWAILAREAGL